MIDPVEALESPKMKELHEMAVSEFRPKGPEYDADASMPEDNINRLFEKGWLTITLPKEIGGMGSTLDTDDPATYLQAIRMVARGCSGTAHCMQVQNHTAWVMNEIATDDQKARYVHPMTERVFLCSFVGSEAKRRHMYMMNTTATPTKGGYVVRGEKNYATNGPMMEFAIIFTAIAGVEDYADNHLMVLVEPGMKGLSMDDSWYRPAGMRAAASPVLTLDDVFVENRNVLASPGYYPKSRWQGKFHLGFCANYLGTAEGMFDWYVDYIRGKGKAGDGIVQMRTGEMQIMLRAAESLFHDAIRAWKTRSVVEAELASIAAKSMAAHVALDISHKIIHAAGSTALFDHFPLSRYIRDLETHVLHAGHDRSAQIIGQSTLGETFDSTLQR